MAYKCLLDSSASIMDGESEGGSLSKGASKSLITALN
jgi:hypothetical protein